MSVKVSCEPRFSHSNHRCKILCEWGDTVVLMQAITIKDDHVEILQDVEEVSATDAGEFGIDHIGNLSADVVLLFPDR